jgi:ABC-type multidrug transport system fused ATPase/permease subunit
VFHLFGREGEMTLHLQELMLMIHVIWGGPFLIFATLFLLYREIQWAAFVGLAAIFLILPCTAFIGNKFGELRRKIVGFTDKRTSFMDEIINGIRVIKFYAWEMPFSCASLTACVLVRNNVETRTSFISLLCFLSMQKLYCLCENMLSKHICRTCCVCLSPG